MDQLLYNGDILSIKDLSFKDFQLILETAKKLKHRALSDPLKNKLIANCFFEPSTRTRLSFEAAALQLGAKIIGFSSDDNLSTQKGESLSDTVRIISAYADLIVIRHPREGAARLAADISDKPVINAGDGANQHPTQALIDFFTIQECQQRFDNLSIALVGDLKYGRTIHSFAEACMLFEIRLYLVSPDGLGLPDPICDALKKHGVRFSLHESLEEIIPKVDILYMTRIQQERLGKSEYTLLKNNYILTTPLLTKAKKNLKILHPLPRLNEIDLEVDNTPFAHYFEQAANGIFIRQALLLLLLKESPHD
jgi:aspartate carbamoyltransferase catalytic subunit